MATSPLVFDDSLLNLDSPSARVPDGEYLLSIRGVKTDVKEWPDDVRFKWDFTIKDGPAGIGQIIRMTTTMKTGFQFSLGRLLNAVGFDPTKLVGESIATEAKLDALRTKLENTVRNREFGALVVESKPDGDGRRWSNVNETYPAEDYAERSKSNVAAVNGPPTVRDQRADEDDVEDLADAVSKW